MCACVHTDGLHPIRSDRTHANTHTHPRVFERVKRRIDTTEREREREIPAPDMNDAKGLLSGHLMINRFHGN